MSLLDDDQEAEPVSEPSGLVGPRPGWRLRSLGSDFAEERTERLAPGQIPADIIHLARLLEVNPEFIMRNPRSYTPPTAHAPWGSDQHLDPDALLD